MVLTTTGVMLFRPSQMWRHNNNDDDDDDDNNNNSNSNNNRIQRRSSRYLQSPHCAVNRLQHVRSNGPGAIVCKSRATCRVTAMWYEGTTHLLNLTELKSHLLEFYFIG